MPSVSLGGPMGSIVWLGSWHITSERTHIPRCPLRLVFFCICIEYQVNSQTTYSLGTGNKFYLFKYFLLMKSHISVCTFMDIYWMHKISNQLCVHKCEHIWLLLCFNINLLLFQVSFWRVENGGLEENV